MNLKNLGFDNWFEEHSPKVQIENCQPARVIAVNRDNFVIHRGTGELLAQLTGKLQYAAESNLDFPTVGDWVLAQFFDDSSQAIIHEIFPRKTLLKRKTAGKQIEYQLIAANIEIAFILLGLDGDFNLRRLERYLAMIRESDIQPVILLTKADLIPATELDQKIAEVDKIAAQDNIIALSNVTGKGIDQIKMLIDIGETVCLLGSSGVGKTTLLNRLLGEETFTTHAVREKDSKGRHTTTRRHLIILKNSGMIIDSPGMRELGNIGMTDGIEATFEDIQFFSQSCRFRDCTHTSEPGCAVLSAIEEEKLDEERYQSYLKLRKESAHHERSYSEKRKRDKHFGKMYKEVVKHKKKTR